eukprot:6056797-Pyramimonas_sp.AAC.1
MIRTLATLDSNHVAGVPVWVHPYQRPHLGGAKTPTRARPTGPRSEQLMDVSAWSPCMAVW